MSVDGDYEAPLFEAGEPRAAADYLIYTTYHAESEPSYLKPEELLHVHGVEPAATYERHGVVVGATLSAGQLAAIRADRRVEYVELDCVDHVARYFRHLSPDRIEGEYAGSFSEGVAVEPIFARLGIDPPDLVVLTALSQFHATLLDEDRDRLRHEPDIVFLEDNIRMYLTD